MDFTRERILCKLPLFAHNPYLQKLLVAKMTTIKGQAETHDKSESTYLQKNLQVKKTATKKICY